ncbi:MAG TPA: DUF378 domain-containing protein [Alphaproteobacteria bacterium]|nr:DUF378 domain-containing protein [Alphaproteobacteria bacterium]
MDIHHIIGLIAYILVIIGALNWGMVGVFNLDVIARLFGPGSLGAKIFYILIGVAGIVMLVVV